ncbi:MAG: SH3 domain-containing protein [Fibrobacterota bacterium]
MNMGKSISALFLLFFIAALNFAANTAHAADAVLRFQGGESGFVIAVDPMNDAYTVRKETQDFGFSFVFDGLEDSLESGSISGLSGTGIDSLAYGYESGGLRLDFYTSEVELSQIGQRRAGKRYLLLVTENPVAEFSDVVYASDFHQIVVDSVTTLSRDMMDIVTVHYSGSSRNPMVTPQRGFTEIAVPGQVFSLSETELSPPSVSGVDSLAAGREGSVVLYHEEDNYNLLTVHRNDKQFSLYFHNKNETDTPFLATDSPRSLSVSLDYSSDDGGSKGDGGDSVAEAQQESRDYETFYIMGDKVNVRSENSISDGNIIDSLSYGTAVSKIASRDNWIQIEFNDRDGWVHESLAKSEKSLTSEERRNILNSDTFALDTTASQDDERIFYVIRDGVNFRNEPTTADPGNVIDQLRIGTRLSFLKNSSGWIRARLENGTVGWVYESLVRDSVDLSSQEWDKIYNSGRLHEIVDASLKDHEEFAQRDKRKERDADSANVVADDTAQSTDDTVQEETQYRYTQYGRDPFVPVPELRKQDSIMLPSVDDMVLVGIIYGGDRNTNFALFEEEIDGDITTFSLKYNDSVQQGRVLRVKEKSVIFLMEDAGFSYVVEKELRK